MTSASHRDLRAGRDAGFTLVEMLVVLVILCFAAVIAASTLSHQPQGIRREQATVRIQAAVAAAKAAALRTGAPVAVNLEALADGHRLQVAGDPPVLRLLVYPDGSTSGGVLLLDDRPLLVVNWLTGAITHAQ